MKNLERQSFHILNKMYEYIILLHGSHNISIIPKQRHSGSMSILKYWVAEDLFSHRRIQGFILEEITAHWIFNNEEIFASDEG